MADQDHSQMTDEQLEKAMLDSVMNSGEAVQWPGTPMDRVEALETPEAQPEPETPPAAEVPEAAPETPAETPTAEVDVDAELSKLAQSEAEARAKHFESVAGRLGGELGFVRERMRLLEARLAATPRQEPDDAPTYEDQPRRAEPAPPVNQDRFQAWVIQRALADATNGFMAEHPDYAEHLPKLKEYAEARRLDTAEILTAGDPVVAQQRLHSLLSEHYWHARAVTDEARRAELQTRRAEQTQKAVAAKRAASVSASGSAPPPKPKSKTPDEMTLEELDAELTRATGGRWTP